MKGVEAFDDKSCLVPIKIHKKRIQNPKIGRAHVWTPVTL